MYRVPYGKGELEFTVPPSMRVTVVESKKIPPPVSYTHLTLPTKA